MAEQASPRPDGRQSGHACVGRVGELGAATPQVFEPNLGGGHRVGRQVQGSHLGLEPRQGEPLCPGQLGAGAGHGPAQLAPDSALEQPRLHPLATDADRLVARVGMAAVRRAQRAAQPLQLHVQPDRRRLRRLVVEPGHDDAQPFEVGTQRLECHGLVQGLELKDGQHVPGGDPRLDQPFLGPGRDLAVAGVPGPQTGQLLARQPLQLGEPADDRAPARFGLLVGDQPVEPSTEADALPDGVEPGRQGPGRTGPRARIAIDRRGDHRPREPACFLAPGCRYRFDVVQRAISWRLVAARLTRLTSSTRHGNKEPFCLTTTNPSLSPAAAVTLVSFPVFGSVQIRRSPFRIRKSESNSS